MATLNTTRNFIINELNRRLQEWWISKGLEHTIAINWIEPGTRFPYSPSVLETVRLPLVEPDRKDPAYEDKMRCRILFLASAVGTDFRANLPYIVKTPEKPCCLHLSATPTADPHSQDNEHIWTLTMQRPTARPSYTLSIVLLFLLVSFLYYSVTSLI